MSLDYRFSFWLSDVLNCNRIFKCKVKRKKKHGVKQGGSESHGSGNFWKFKVYVYCLPLSTFFSFSSTMNNVTLVPKPGRKEMHAVREPLLLRGIAVLWRSCSTKEWWQPVAAQDGAAGWGSFPRRQSSRKEAPVPSRWTATSPGFRQMTASLSDAHSWRSRCHSPGGGAVGRSIQFHHMAPWVKASQLVEDRVAVCLGIHSYPSISFLSSGLTPRCWPAVRWYSRAQFWQCPSLQRAMGVCDMKQGGVKSVIYVY